MSLPDDILSAMQATPGGKFTYADIAGMREFSGVAAGSIRSALYQLSEQGEICSTRMPLGGRHWVSAYSISRKATEDATRRVGAVLDGWARKRVGIA